MEIPDLALEASRMFWADGKRIPLAFGFFSPPAMGIFISRWRTGKSRIY
jgi:hypothetical protein